MKRPVMILLLILLSGCVDPSTKTVKDPTASPDPIVKSPDITAPAASPSPAPATPAPMATPSPTASPTPSPSPTPYPLTGTWQKSDDPSIMFDFQANGTGGEASCQWSFTYVIMNSNQLDTGTGSNAIYISFITTNTSPSYCLPANHIAQPGKECDWSLLSPTQIQMVCHYGYGAAVFNRLP